ncbi:hypothetical protein K435DRAFT_878827 [Dendrothele bispora CBS 962.96]|uniref:Uncharacterized protein n=1 Tax=Dendrothele bispora (strain CBS 962.96) TaxID=1314807 RepID=A0A4S8KMD2_DENBC|nr:hypothetical protein K435DRAFT_878827 [Dendrothele bispora CBS 962.96]
MAPLNSWETYIQLFTSTSPTTPVTKLHRRKLGIFTPKAVRTHLEIYPAGHHIADEIFFIYVKQSRHRRNKNTNTDTNIEDAESSLSVVGDNDDDNKDDSKKKHVIVPTDIDFEGYWVKKDESKPRDPETYVKRIRSESGKEKKIVSIPTEINDDIH